MTKREIIAPWNTQAFLQLRGDATEQVKLTTGDVSLNGVYLFEKIEDTSSFYRRSLDLGNQIQIIHCPTSRMQSDRHMGVYPHPDYRETETITQQDNRYNNLQRRLLAQEMFKK